MASLKKRGDIWYARFRRTEDGKTQEALFSLGTKYKDQARRKLFVMEDQAKAGTIDPFEGNRRLAKGPELTTVDEAFEIFIMSRTELCRPATVKSYSNILRYWISHQELTGRLMSSIQYADINKFLHRRGVASSTRATDKRHIKAFWRYAIVRKWVSKDIVSPVRLPKADTKTQAKMMTAEEFDRFLRAHEKMCTQRKGDGAGHEWQEQRWFKPMMLLYQDAGLRRSEATKLELRHVLGMDQIHVEIAKGHRERIVPLSSRAKTALAEYLKNRPNAGKWLFPNPKDSSKTITDQHVWNVFTKVRQFAKIRDGVTIHGMRHAAVTRWLQIGLSTIEAQSMAGHSSPTVTQMYAHMATRELSDKYKKLEAAAADRAK